MLRIKLSPTDSCSYKSYNYGYKKMILSPPYLCSLVDILLEGKALFSDRCQCIFLSIYYQYGFLFNVLQFTNFGASQSVKLLSCVQLFATPQTAARQASLPITNFWSQLKLMSMESVIIQPSHPLSSPSPPTFSLSQHQGLFQ